MIPTDADCQSCGACCRSQTLLRGYVAFEHDPGIDPALFEANPDAGDDSAGKYAMRQTAQGACVALTGEIGKSVSCSTYETRPNCCRSFTAGSHRCMTTRILAGVAAHTGEELIAALRGRT